MAGAIVFEVGIEAVLDGKTGNVTLQDRSAFGRLNFYIQGAEIEIFNSWFLLGLVGDFGLVGDEFFACTVSWESPRSGAFHHGSGLAGSRSR